MPGGAFFGALFFVLVVFAAWTSTISLIEPAVAWLVENHGFTRRRAADCRRGHLAAGHGDGAVLQSLGAVQVHGQDRVRVLDFITANVMLPLGGLAIAVFTAWFMSRQVVRNEWRSRTGACTRSGTSP